MTTAESALTGKSKRLAPFSPLSHLSDADKATIKLFESIYVLCFSARLRSNVRNTAVVGSKAAARCLEVLRRMNVMMACGEAAPGQQCCDCESRVWVQPADNIGKRYDGLGQIHACWYLGIVHTVGRNVVECVGQQVQDHGLDFDGEIFPRKLSKIGQSVSIEIAQA